MPLRGALCYTTKKQSICWNTISTQVANIMHIKSSAAISKDAVQQGVDILQYLPVGNNLLG